MGVENVNRQNIIRMNDVHTFIFTEDENLLKQGTSHTYVIPYSLYYIVQKYIESNKELLSVLMKPLSNGNIPYWEINFRKQIIDNITHFFNGDVNKDFNEIQVSNALSAFDL